MKKVLTIFAILIIGKVSKETICGEGCAKCDEVKSMNCLDCKDDFVLVGPYCGETLCPTGGGIRDESRRLKTSPLSLSLSLSKKKKKKKVEEWRRKY